MQQLEARQLVAQAEGRQVARAFGNVRTDRVELFRQADGDGELRLDARQGDAAAESLVVPV